MHSPVVIIEGLIASGKSTLAVELGQALGPDCLTLLEPDERDNANPYLASFYADSILGRRPGMTESNAAEYAEAQRRLYDAAAGLKEGTLDHLNEDYGMHRWGFTMQCHLLAKRFRMQLRAQWHCLDDGGPSVLDRSYYGDTCFARMLAKSGHLTQDEFATYQTLYHSMTASVLLPNVCIRVLVDPKTSQQRIVKRYEEREGRQMENVIGLGYLQALDKEIDHMVSVLRHQGVTVIDMPWDVVRDTADQRAQAVAGLAARIQSLEPLDLFLDLHRRTT